MKLSIQSTDGAKANNLAAGERSGNHQPRWETQQTQEANGRRSEGKFMVFIQICTSIALSIIVFIGLIYDIQDMCFIFILTSLPLHEGTHNWDLILKSQLLVNDLHRKPLHCCFNARYYMMGDFQPCPLYVWNHKKYQIQPCPGIQSWWDSNDWLTKIIFIFIKLQLLILLRHVIWLWFPRLHSSNMT